MKRSNYIFPAILLCSLTISVWAQTTQRTAEKPKPAPKHYVPVFLGHSQVSGGMVTKAVFDSLVYQGLTSDSGRVVSGFRFAYAERNVYEDSIGNLVPMTDYNSEYCLGDSLTPVIKSGLRFRTKPGDTLYFDQVDVKLPKGGIAEGKPMRFIIR